MSPFKINICGGRKDKKIWEREFENGGKERAMMTCCGDDDFINKLLGMVVLYFQNLKFNKGTQVAFPHIFAVDSYSETQPQPRREQRPKTRYSVHAQLDLYTMH